MGSRSPAVGLWTAASSVWLRYREAGPGEEVNVNNFGLRHACGRAPRMLTARTGGRFPGIPRQPARINPEAALGCHVRGAAGHDRCAAIRAARLLVQGENRVEAVRLAQQALGDPCCRDNLRCVWHAVLTLIEADEVAWADYHTCQLHGLPRWRGNPIAAAVFDLLMGRISFLVGDVAGARDAFERLLADESHPATRVLAVAWLVELHLYVGDL